MLLLRLASTLRIVPLVHLLFVFDLQYSPHLKCFFSDVIQIRESTIAFMQWTSILAYLL